MTRRYQCAATIDEVLCLRNELVLVASQVLLFESLLVNAVVDLGDGLLRRADVPHAVATEQDEVDILAGDLFDLWLRGHQLFRWFQLWLPLVREVAEGAGHG